MEQQQRPTRGLCRVSLPSTMTADAVLVSLKSIVGQLEKYERSSKITRFKPRNVGTKENPSYVFEIGVNGGENDEED